MRPVRKEHDDLPIDEDVTLKELERGAFNELKALTEENASFVGEHLVMAARLLEVDPEAAHPHAVSASRRGGRIAVVRETLGICDHAYIISAGHVLAAGRPAEIVANDKVREVYLGEHFKL